MEDSEWLEGGDKEGVGGKLENGVELEVVGVVLEEEVVEVVFLVVIIGEGVGGGDG